MSRPLAIRARSNPLAVERTERLPFRFSDGNWGSHLARLGQMEYRGAIVGGQGCGKTTLLEQLAGRLAGQGIHTVSMRAARAGGTRREELSEWVRPLSARNVLLLDSAEQLRRRDWWWLLRTTAAHQIGLVVTVHRRCLLRTWLTCRPTPGLLRDLLMELGFDPEVQANFFQQAENWYARHGGNLREVFRSMYDEVAAGRAG